MAFAFSRELRYDMEFMPETTEDPQTPLHRTAAAMREIFDEGVPAVLRGVGPLFAEAEVFEWIRRVHPADRANPSLDKLAALKRSWGLSPEPPPERVVDPGRGAELFRAGGLVMDPSPFLPTADHPTFIDWVEHTRARLGGDFGMQAPGLECASWDALDRLQTLLTPVLTLTGPRTYRYNAFAGDYRRTPFGFHLDPHQEAVFQYVITGRRRGYFWEGLTLSYEDAAWIEDCNGLSAPQREPEAVVELEPGDLVFWPGTHLHGFEAEGPSLALSMVIDRVSPRRRADVVDGLALATLRGRAALPAVVERDLLPEDAVIEPRWASGLAYESHDDTLIVGVCGRTFDWPDRGSIAAAVGLFDFLRSHRRVSVREIIDRCADPSLPGDQIREVLAMLGGLGYLRD